MLRDEDFRQSHWPRQKFANFYYICLINRRLDTIYSSLDNRETVSFG